VSAIRHVGHRPGPLWALSAAAIACSALAGCASTASAGTAGGVSSGLCGSTSRVDRLVVHRADLLPQNHPYFTFPAKITVTDPGQARRVAQAACALPPMPSGTISCPADMGIVYHLTFVTDGRELPPVQADAGGCGTVHGLGQIRWTTTSPGFWPALAAAMGIRQPSDSTFSGTFS
jgi:hypothetical protein